MVLVRRGGLRVGDEKREMAEAQLATFERSGDRISFAATKRDTEVLLLAGEPIEEVRPHPSNGVRGYGGSSTLSTARARSSCRVPLGGFLSGNDPWRFVGGNR